MLEAIDVLDICSIAPDGRVQLFIVVEDDEWQSPQRVLLLQEKINAAASYALDGQLLRDHPEAAGKTVSLVLRAATLPDDVGVFVDRVRPILAQDGLPFTVELAPFEEQEAA